MNKYHLCVKFCHLHNIQDADWFLLIKPGYKEQLGKYNVNTPEGMQPWKNVEITG